MPHVLKRHLFLIASALVLTAGTSLAAPYALAAASSAAGAAGTSGGGSASGTGNGGGAPPPRCGSSCNPALPPRVAHSHWRPHSACSHREPKFDRFGHYVGEIVVNACIAGE